MASCPNEIGSSLWLPIYGGEMLVDATVECIRLACAHSWCVDANGYACGTIDGRRVLYHRILLGILDSPEILCDHRNLLKLDNRRENLRRATKAQNGQNRTKRKDNKSGYKGVYFCRTTQRWRAEIACDNDRRKLGRFDSAVKAALAYDRAAISLHGDFARTNFPRENYEL